MCAAAAELRIEARDQSRGRYIGGEGMVGMKRRVLGVLLLCAAVGQAIGCGGGGLTQADMRRHAIRRTPDDNEEEEAAAESVVPAPRPGDSTSPDDTANDTSTVTAPSPSSPVGSAVEPRTPAARDSRPATPRNSPEHPDQTDADESPVPPGSSVTDATQSARPVQPAEPLTATERRRRTLDNLQRLGTALQQYTSQNGLLPAACIRDDVGRPLLSWRVELLPYLGYGELHEQFRLYEPWNSAHNLALLPRIPAEFQSPERFDEKTNYLLPVASFTPFSGPRGLGLRRVEDGLPDTVLVVEVDDHAAVPWTQPEDLQLDVSDFEQHVGTLREDGFFVVWGDGSVTRVTGDCTPQDRHAIFTHDAGDSFAASSVKAAVDIEPAADRAAVAATTADAAPQAPGGRKGLTPGPSAEGTAHAMSDGRLEREPSDTLRWPIPDSMQLEQARQLVREIYHGEYEQKRSPRDQQALAKRMLQHAQRMGEDPAGQYVLLDIARKIATQTGDTVTAWSAFEMLAARFSLDLLSEGEQLLAQLAKKERSEAGVRVLLEQSSALIDRAVEAENFDAADSLCQIASGAARQLGDRALFQELETTAQRVTKARQTSREMRRVLAALTDADDPQANLLVGRYHCLVRGDWSQGLTFLARGSDSQLSALAEAELRSPTIAQDQLQLAEGWWEMGNTDSLHQKPYRLRAGHWYRLALPQLPTGLWRTKVELRLNELQRQYGTPQGTRQSGSAAGEPN